MKIIDPFPLTFYGTEVNGRAMESGKGTLETRNKISYVPLHHRKLCVVCVTPLGYSLARFVSTIVYGRRGKQKQGMMMKAL